MNQAFQCDETTLALQLRLRHINSQLEEDTTNRPRVLIVGAGLAGLAAACRLHQTPDLNVHISIIEGSNQCGGRLQSHATEPGILMGAQWLHGSYRNSVFKYMKKAGWAPFMSTQQTKLNYDDEEDEDEDDDDDDDISSTFFEDGVTELSTIKIFPHILGTISLAISNAETFANDVDSNDHMGENGQGDPNNELFNGSVYVYVCECVARAIIQYEKKENVKIDHITQQYIQSMINWRMKKEEAISGGHPRELSLKYFGEFDDDISDIPLTTDAVKFLLSSLLNDIGLSTPSKNYSSSQTSSCQIHYNKIVSKVEWCCEEDSAVQVTCSDGEVFYGDHVILTTSLGVLKHCLPKTTKLESNIVCEDSWSGVGGGDGTIIFSPALPNWKIEAIQSLGFGSIEKIFLGFESQNMQHKVLHSMDLFWDPRKRVDMDCDVEVEVGSKPWWRSMWGIDFYDHVSLSGGSILPSGFIGTRSRNQKYFVAWVNGVRACKALHDCSNEEIAMKMHSVMTTFSGVKYDSSCASLPLCDRLIKTSWTDNPLFRGSYSFVPVGSSGSAFETIAKPLTVNDSFATPCSTSSSSSSSDQQPVGDSTPPLLLFAGEHTHRSRFQTLDGAFSSGEREAMRLVRFISTEAKRQ